MTQTEQNMTRQQLMDFLDSDDNTFGLDSIATHGFLTATVVGKPLSTWLSDLFEGNDSEINADIKAALVHWQNDLLVQLKDEEQIELPLLDNESDNETNSDEESAELEEDEVDFSLDSDLSAWAVGFVDAMYGDNADDWFDNEETEDDVAMLTLPMIVLSGIDEEDETLQDLRSDDGLLAQMANNLEKNLTELFLLFHTND